MEFSFRLVRGFENAVVGVGKHSYDKQYSTMKIVCQEAFFVCLLEKICYNIDMVQKRGQSSWLGEMTEEKKSGLVYSAAVAAAVLLSFVLLIVVSAAGYTDSAQYENAEWYRYVSFLLAPVGFAAVGAIYFFKTKTPVREVAGKCRFKYFVLAVTLQVGLLSLAQVNTLFLEFLGRFGYKSPEIRLPSLNGAGLFGVLLTVAVLPAVFEELIFRGLLLKGLKNFGTVAAVLLCGALFSLYHQNPAQTIYQFLCGAAFALVAVKAGSILPTVLSHFLNNAFIIVMEKVSGGEIPRSVQIPLLAFSALCLAGSLAYLIFFDKKSASAKGKEKADKKGFFLCAALGIVVCAVVWLSAFAAGLGG